MELDEMEVRESGRFIFDKYKKKFGQVENFSVLGLLDKISILYLNQVPEVAVSTTSLH